MARSPRQPKKTKLQLVETDDDIDSGGGCSKNDFSVVFTPRNESQQRVVELWPRSRIMFLVGTSGGGKSHCALSMALLELLRYNPKDKPKLLLSRPLVTVTEKLGFLPGSVDEKLEPWFGAFHDVFGQMSFNKWEELQKTLTVESVALGLLRGRTIRSGVLIVDEAQNITPEQLKCVLTRIGENGRIILTGDPEQSDLYKAYDSPLMDAANKLQHLDTVSVVKFTEKDQVRDPLINEILKVL